MVLNHIIISIMVVQEIVIYQNNVAIMMMAFLLFGTKREWCGNLIAQVDMCHNIFLNCIVQECVKTVYS